MYRFFIVLILLSMLIPFGKLSAQLDNMTQEEMKKKAEEMGFSLEDYLKLRQQLQNSQLQPQQQVSIPKNELKDKGKTDKSIISPPINKPLETYFVPAFGGRKQADSLPAFGYNIFSTSPTAFVTSLNVPVLLII